MYGDQLNVLLEQRCSRAAFRAELLSLWLGDPRPLRQFITQHPAQGLWSWRRLQYEVSLLVAHCVGRIVEREDHCNGPRFTTSRLFYRTVEATGGGPRVIHNPVEVGDALLDVLNGPCTLDAHRLGMLTLLDRIEGGALAPDGTTLDALSVALHYTDHATHLGELSTLDRAPIPRGSLDCSVSWPYLKHLPDILRDPDRLREHLLAGLASPSDSRRGLSLRLLALWERQGAAV